MSSKAPDTNDAVLRTQRVLPFPPDAVYQAFARPDQLARWWGPDGFTNTFERFEFQPGGRWNFVMHGPGGHDYANENIFRELVSGARVVIDHILAPRFVLTVTLAAVEDGTLITWHQELDDPKVAAALRSMAEPANEQNLDRLTQVLQAAAGQP